MQFNNQIMPVRKALIIGSPGEEGVDYLYSASTDVSNIKNHLLSSRGGRWNEDEIITLWKPDIATLASVIEDFIADYFFVYYAGHGYENSNHERKICLDDADVSDFFLLNKSPRQLIILDCCREKEFPAISGIPKEEEWLPFEGFYPEREAFDKYILQSPPGKKIIHATKSGFASWEDKNGRGGIFTTNLLLSTRSFQNGYAYSPIGIELLLKKAKKYIRQSGDEQEPEIVYSTGDLQVPFALFIKNEVKPVYNKKFNHNKPRKVLKRETSDSEFLAAGFFFLAIALIIANAD